VVLHIAVSVSFATKTKVCDTTNTKQNTTTLANKQTNNKQTINKQTNKQTNKQNNKTAGFAVVRKRVSGSNTRTQQQQKYTLPTLGTRCQNTLVIATGYKNGLPMRQSHEQAQPGPG
jgi:ribosome assembly protein YihI (activator of Der GTPase)